MRYSGKKKRFTNNTNVCINTEGVIISKSAVGSTNATLPRRAPCLASGRESMKDASFRIHTWGDKGYQGMAKELPGTTESPTKDQKNTAR